MKSRPYRKGSQNGTTTVKSCNCTFSLKEKKTQHKQAAPNSPGIKPKE